MQRREFITLVGGAAVAWPIDARAQQDGRVRRIGVILPAASDDAEFQTWMGAFLQALAQLGWTIGRNIRIDTHWATANAAKIRQQAEQLAALAPDVILTAGTSTAGPMLQATRTVPIVFATVVDPVGAGFIDSLARPGGNATGFLLYEYSLGGNGWSCSSRLRRLSRALQFCGMPQHHPVLGSLQQSRPWRRHSTLMWLRSICAMPESWSAISRHSRALPMGA